MAIRTDFAAGEVLAAADLNDTFGAKSNLASPTFTGTPAAPTAAVATNTTQIATTAFVLANAGGKILQVVRATDTTARSTTSATYVDVTGMSVTITPTKNTSTLIIAAVFNAQSAGTTTAEYQITDSANATQSGAQEVPHGGGTNPTQGMNMWAWATPATSSAVTYKLRFKGDAANAAIVQNDLATGQMYAIEVAA